MKTEDGRRKSEAWI